MLIDIASVSDLDDDNNKDVIANLVDNSTICQPDTKELIGGL